MDKRYTVFVSSTYKDLVDARWAVAKALMRLNLIPLGMENFTASDKSQWEIIKKTIDLSDYYVLILGNCYGSIDPETGISYTEKEYRYALEHGIPCLTFLSKDVPIKPELADSDEHRQKLKALRDEASAGRMVDFWTNPDELTAKVATAIVISQMQTPRPGWVRNPQTSPEVAEELARLSRRNAELELQLLSINTVEPKIKTELIDEEINVYYKEGTGAKMRFTVRTKNVGAVAISRVGISARIDPVGNNQMNSILRQLTFNDLAPGEYLDIEVPIERFDAGELTDEIDISYTITGLNISNPETCVVRCKVNIPRLLR